MFQALHFSNHIAAGRTSPKREDQTIIPDTKYYLTFNTIIAPFSEPEMPLWWANTHHLPLGVGSWMCFSSTFEEKINLKGIL